MKSRNVDALSSNARGLRLLKRVTSGLLTAAVLGGALVSAGGIGAEPAAAASSDGVVESLPFVSATPSAQSGRCTLDEVRATKRWWMFGANAQFDFGTKGTAAPKLGKSPGDAVEGSTVVTDTQGNLRFWSNGVDVWGADGQPIKNSGGGLGKSSSAQTVVAMPAIGSPGKYYVVMSGYEAEMGTEKAMLYYSVIDMNANGGKGEMIQKNIALGTPGVAGEGLAATANATGDGFWVYSVASNSNQIHRWEFTSEGPVSKTPQSQTMQDQFSSYSTIHFDNSIGANQGVVLASRGVGIYTMVTVDRKTGLLIVGHRVKHLPTSGRGQLYGAAFSPSGRYMFFADIYGVPSHVYRVDLQKKTADELRDSRIDLGELAPGYRNRSGGAVKLGPDGNIWVNDAKDAPNLVKITNPDAVTPGAMQRVRLDTIPGVASGWGLPDMVTGCEKRVPQVTATVSAPKDLTLGDAIDPVTVRVTNTGNAPLSNISTSAGLDTCPKNALLPNESMTCVATTGYWGEVTQSQNDQGFVKGVGYSISAKGSIGADPPTGLDRIVTITVNPIMDLPIVKTHTLAFDMNGGDASRPGIIKQRDGSPWGTLPTASQAGKVFLGWHTAKSSGSQVTSSTVANSSLTTYAQWRPAQFNVVFYGNAEMGEVTGSTRSIVVDSGCADCLLTANGFTKTTGAPALIDQDSGESTEVNSTFLGWSLDPSSRTGDIADRAVAGGLSQTDGATVKLYAVWDDAPRFIITSYPNRFFNLREAKSGAITEDELLRTVEATDKETNPLVPKTSAQVQSSGSDVGITLFDYNAGDFTALADTGVVTVTYKVKDEVENVAFLRIRVTVSDDAPLEPDAVQYLRGISPQYADNGSGTGGLSEESLWLTDPTRKEALTQALDGNTATRYCLDADAITELRTQIVDHGLGNSKTPDGLAASADVIREEGAC